MKFLRSLLCLAIAIGCSPTFAAEQGKTTKTVKPKISKEKAQKAALKLVQGELLRWDMEVQQGIPSYTFYIRSKDGRINEVALNGNTGKQDHIGVELEYGSKDGRGAKNTHALDKDRWKEAKLSKDQAQVKALESCPGTVEAWELLIWKMGDKDKLVYEYRIESKGERKMVCVDSMTGAILATSIFADGN